VTGADAGGIPRGIDTETSAQAWEASDAVAPRMSTLHNGSVDLWMVSSPERACLLAQ